MTRVGPMTVIQGVAYEVIATSPKGGMIFYVAPGQPVPSGAKVYDRAASYYSVGEVGTATATSFPGGEQVTFPQEPGPGQGERERVAEERLYEAQRHSLAQAQTPAERALLAQIYGLQQQLRDQQTAELGSFFATDDPNFNPALTQQIQRLQDQLRALRAASGRPGQDTPTFLLDPLTGVRIPLPGTPAAPTALLPGQRPSPAPSPAPVISIAPPPSPPQHPLAGFSGSGGGGSTAFPSGPVDFGANTGIAGITGTRGFTGTRSAPQVTLTVNATTITRAALPELVREFTPLIEDMQRKGIL